MSGRLYNVYIERARSPAPDAAAKLAQAMASHYGIDAAELERRIGTGRFRVKGNVDKATADSFAADLARLGAVVHVVPNEEATPPPPAGPSAAKKPAPMSLVQPRITPPPAGAAPVVKPAVPFQPVVAAPVPKPTPAPTPVPVPAASGAAAKPQFSSGLAAAASAPRPADGDDGLDALGALAGEMKLSTLDGEDEASLAGASRKVALPASFGPPPSAMGAGPAASSAGGDDFDVDMDDDDAPEAPASSKSASLEIALPAGVGPAASVTALGASKGAHAAAAALGGPIDMFAPPEAAGELQLSLEVETVTKKKGVLAPPRAEPAPAPVTSGEAQLAGASSSTMASSERRAPAEPGWKGFARDERARFVAGVVVAAALGCVPAMVIGAVRERSAFADIDADLHERQAQVLTRSDWDNLDRVRASFVERKRSQRQSIALTSLLVWAAVSGGVAWFWFRKLDWDGLLGPAPR